MKFFRKKTEKPRRSLAQRQSEEKPAFSYYGGAGRGAELEEGRLRPFKPKKNRSSPFFKKIPGFLATLAIGVSMVYSLTLDNNPKVILNKPALPALSVVRSQPDYEKAVFELFNGSIFNRSKVTINTAKLENKLKLQFPELEKAEISLPLFGRRPTVHLSGRVLSLILISPSGRFALDSHGIAAIAGNDLNAAAQLDLPQVSDESGLEVKLGTQVLSEEEVAFISTVYYQLKTSNLTVTGLTMPPIAAQLHLRLKEVPYYVKFNLKTDARAAVGTYLAAKAKFDRDNIKPAEYVDVRVEEKAFYK